MRLSILFIAPENVFYVNNFHLKPVKENLVLRVTVRVTV